MAKQAGYRLKEMRAGDTHRYPFSQKLIGSMRASISLFRKKHPEAKFFVYREGEELVLECVSNPYRHPLEDMQVGEVIFSEKRVASNARHYAKRHNLPHKFREERRPSGPGYMLRRIA